MSIVDVIFLVTAGLSLGFLGVGVRILRSIHVSIESRLGRVDSFVAPRGDEPSHLALLFDAMVERGVSKVGGSKMGVASGVARSEKSAQVDYIKAVVVQEAPAVAMVLDQVFPKWGKMFANNPQMASQVMEYVKNMGGGDKVASENGAAQQPTLFPLGGN